MDEENKEKLILQLVAEVSLLRDILALTLIAHPLPPGTLEAYDRIAENPYLAGSPISLEITDKARERILRKFLRDAD